MNRWNSSDQHARRNDGLTNTLSGRNTNSVVVNSDSKNVYATECRQLEIGLFSDPNISGNLLFDDATPRSSMNRRTTLACAIHWALWRVESNLRALERRKAVADELNFMRRPATNSS